jgi:serine/threonine-protein kinase
VPDGAVVVWTDDHEEKGKTHAYGAMIDDTGHPTSSVRDLSPEGTVVFRPALTQVGERVVLLYWDGAGSEPGVKVRWLRSDGRIAGPSITVDHGRPANLWPSLTRTPDGFVVAWQDDMGSGNNDDVYLQKLAPDLSRVGDESQATSVGSVDASARTPSVAVSSDERLLVAYVLDTQATRVLKLRRFALGDAEVSVATSFRGGWPVTIAGDAKKGAAPDAPVVGCGKDGCFLVWHAGAHGAYAAQVDVEKQQLVWHKVIATAGGHPAIGQARDGTLLIAFFDGGLVKIASLSGDGVGQASVVGKVTGDPPRPWIAPGARPGEWYVAWQSAVEGEPLVARVACRAP